ncbi:hypothetical protein PIB30_069402 [Stylosanthes scabra]|uniref:NB-ARC domain-containing protein n=1 Tax=Stylosanthes scabra TaxID=79078 RepID=A0ABU6TMV2_9FABA|nr:hypothetical protein [Stylosanthes scabra]
MNDLNILQHDLVEKLARKKFFVVLDDAWNESYDDWNKLLKPFQNGVKGSKNLITTRSRKVASAVQTIPSYNLSLLSQEDCWLVLAKHALLPTELMVNPTLEKIGKEIVNKCSGLPLAAQTLGGLLRGIYEVQYWSHILKSGIWELSEVSKSFFQPLHGSCDIFVMHDLIHDLATFYAGEFFYRAEELENSAGIGNFGIKTHHLSHNAKGKYSISKLLAACDTVKHTRTFLEINLEQWDRYPPLDPFDIKNAPGILLSKLKCLRVLSFKFFPLDSLPDSIGDLIHLLYLDLSYTYTMSLPESMSKLYNLQTLKLYGCVLLKALPVGLQDLVNLRHLDIRETSLEEMPKGMSRLTKLQILSDFVVGKHEGNGTRELGPLEVMDLNWSPDVDVADSLTERDVLDKLQPHNNLQVLIIRGYRGTTFAD